MKDLDEKKIRKRKKEQKLNREEKSNREDKKMRKADNLEEGKEKKKRSTNREIIMTTYIFIGLFVGLIAYFSYFLIVESSDVINNTYNKRQDLLATRVVRGKILSNNYEVLAETKENEDGSSKRIYPYKDLFAHIVGRNSNGKTGIESLENFKLLTSNINPISKVMNELAGEKSIGDNIVTTLDLNLQKVAYNALGNHKGAVVVMDPSTGKILAMVSKPDYDPNTISVNWNTLVEDSENDSALINRATQGLYPPGSIFKIITTLEYLRENPKNYLKYRYNCVGKDNFNGMEINCYNSERHGEEDLLSSFANSCNTSYATIGNKLNLSKYRRLCEQFLFNSSLPTKLEYRKSSFVLDEDSSVQEVAQTAIGQGKTQISPFHAALIVSAIANSGTLMQPYVVDHIENYNGDMVKKYLPSTYDSLISANEAKVITRFMKEVVNSGTAEALKNNKYSVAGKTGSADHNSNLPAHAWFVGFASKGKKKVAVSVIVESVGTGSTYAVPIAKKLFDNYFD
ncbi:peptidoglycan D,D-transpeptidase FtsI family protein [Anaeromicropila herbilytica]|uniref:Beta-lactamase n=1 Tax=Anaeromicropila herbilytica TaxID=2785025 RepID=A0A7R7EKL6_9FIRM|nr:penicillin-binding transpeptidase domain-containing protein [Anaeromicropila herbilytica]BCN30504.1 beta-lactamase [Anaeromicropila herbilytica]